ncbi:protein kinase [Thermococcus sp. JCM 11816]|uniref:protein kinase domain-containing protein n=1 Tax=Thermococcus sp. (strain JCM 11816 / KS-1) TaxID=1295125 RepID=UPI003466A35D
MPRGLKHAHSKQVFHRDLKPQNVLITSNLTPKITDWGLAKVGAVSTTATTTKGLTLLYAAPEQLDEETYGHTDARTDIYQLGLIFYELLTGGSYPTQALPMPSSWRRSSIRRSSRSFQAITTRSSPSTMESSRSSWQRGRKTATRALKSS